MGELSRTILERVIKHVCEPDAVSPVTIADDIYTELYEQVDHDFANKISDAVFDLVSALVVDEGRYK